MSHMWLYLRKPKVFGSLLVVFILAGVLAVYAGHSSNSDAVHPDTGLITNETFIKNIYTEVDMKNPKDVFRYVYMQLDDEVTIFPSENIYYVKFALFGKVHYATITMYVDDREQGILGFGYVNREEHKSRQKHFPMQGGSHDFAKKDGLIMKKIDEFTYSTTYLGKTVVFHLFNDGVNPPKKAKLRPDEEFVGPTFDESGLRFFLVFNKTVNRLYWVLNEDGFVPETFYQYSDNVVVGDRTEFAFYDDKENNRKIMVGVEGENVLQNNWYDGPFDQLPDNFVKVGQLEVQKYLERHYPYYKGAIDKYGHFKSRKGSRIAVAPYIVYFEHEELNFVDSLKALNMPTPDFYARITEQRFDVPASYYADIADKPTAGIKKQSAKQSAAQH